jgi:hypothetical protein
MSIETTEVLTHKDIRLREVFDRIETRDDVVVMLRNLLAHCNERQLPFDDCMGEAVTAPPLAPICTRGDIKVGDVVVVVYGSGVTECRVISVSYYSMETVNTGNIARTNCFYYSDIVYIGTKKDYQRLVKERKRAEETRRKLEGR